MITYQSGNGADGFMLSTHGGNSKGDTSDIENYDADKEVNMNMLILQILPPT